MNNKKIISDEAVEQVYQLMNETIFLAKVLDADEDLVLEQSEREGLSIILKRFSDTLCEITFGIENLEPSVNKSIPISASYPPNLRLHV